MFESMQNRIARVSKCKYKVINFEKITDGNQIKHNPKWPHIIKYYKNPYKILIIGGPGSGETNALLELRNHLQNIDKTYLYAEDLYEGKYQFLINKCEKVGLHHFNDPKAFAEYSNDMQDVYKKYDS